MMINIKNSAGYINYTYKSIFPFTIMSITDFRKYMIQSDNLRYFVYLILNYL